MRAYVAVSQKSVAAAFLLPMFFGPLGMLYATISGAIWMMFIGFFGVLIAYGVGFAAFGFAGLLLGWGVGGILYATCIIWSVKAAGEYNRSLLDQMDDYADVRDSYSPPPRNIPAPSAPSRTPAVEIECPECGHAVGLDDIGKFCKECGGKMPVVKQAAAKADAAPAKPTPTHCETCSAPFNSRNGYCDFCGWMPV